MMKEYVKMEIENYGWDSCERMTTYFVGTAEEIKSLYRSIRKQSMNKYSTCRIFPQYFDFPKFNVEKMCYALAIREIDYANAEMTVINSDTMLSILINENIVEGKGIR